MPSPATLLGLVKGAGLVERVWFDVALAGRNRAEIGLPNTVDDSFILTDDDTIEPVLARYRQVRSDVAVLRPRPRAGLLGMRHSTAPRPSPGL